MAKSKVTKSVLVPDWKKQAASTVSSNEDIEKAFLDQAYMMIQNKATPIMKSPYRIGFEVVHKNDDNTRMVGIFVFRVNKELFYAPVFFINGAIKGTDLFYRHTPKRMVPLTNPWVEHLMSLCQMHEGVGISQRERNQSRQSMNLSSIVNPPSNVSGGGMSFKFASLKEVAGDEWQGLDQFVNALHPDAVEKSAVFGLKTYSRKNLDSWRKLKSEDLTSEQKMLLKADDARMSLDKKASVAEGESILRKFIEEDGGFNAIRKIANTCKDNFKFARALMQCSSPENYMPVLSVNQSKRANEAVPTELLTLHTGLVENPNVKSASEKDVAKGYQIDDKRNEELAADVAYVAAEHQLTSVSEPGIFQVVMADGGTHEMLCAPYKHMSIRRSGCNLACDGEIDYGPEMVVIDQSDNHSTTVGIKHRKIMGQFDRDIAADIGVAIPEKGKAYRIYSTLDKAFSEPFKVTGVKKNDAGISEVNVQGSFKDSDNESPILVNPDYERYDIDERVFGSSCRFVEVASETKDDYTDFKNRIDLGDRAALDTIIFDNGYKKASIRLAGDEFLIAPRAGHGYAPAMSKLAATMALMVECGLREDTAEDILKMASEKDGVTFNFLYQPVAEEVKRAHNLRAPAFPEFPDMMNDEFGAVQQPNSQYIMRAHSDIPDVPQHRIGDAMSPDPTEMLSTGSPMDLYGISQERGMGSLFEHGVVGELVNTYDSIALTEKYLPDLETALDRIGRLLFLFYWKPEDFAEAYGSDDQSQLENKLISNFKSFGDLVLELLQKSKRHQEGSVSLT